MIVLIGWIVLGVIGTAYASMRGGIFFKWLIIGIVFGPFALVHALVHCVRCPVCSKLVNTKAKMCPFCRIKMPDRKGAINIKRCAVELALFAIIVAIMYWAMRMGYLKGAISELPFAGVITL